MTVDLPAAHRGELSELQPHHPSDRLAGQTAIVTGAASGVGRETAEMFRREGAHVIAADRDKDGLAALTAADRMVTVAGDVTELAHLEELVEAAAATPLGHASVLVNNAGATIRGAIEDTTPELFTRSVEVNLGAGIQLARLVAPAMRAARNGSIINIASITSLQGLGGAIAYTAAKGGVTAATRALAVELAPDNVRANAICPGVVDSPMTYEHADSMPDPAAHYTALRHRHPMRRLAHPRDVAFAALFLASPESAYVTGIALPVDGGRHAT